MPIRGALAREFRIFGQKPETRPMQLELDDNAAFRTAWEIVSQTPLSLFLTGKAGTGKTTFLRMLRQELDKNFVILAPTGVAAVNAQGVTLHSFFGIPPRLDFFDPRDRRMRIDGKEDPNSEGPHNIYQWIRLRKEKADLIKSLHLLVIDEVSMVRADLLNLVDTILRSQLNRWRPFGGLQLLLIGDLFQLPPILSSSARENFLKHFDSPYFFSCPAIKQMLLKNQLLVVELDKVYRQRDQTFIDLLNRIRVDRASPADFRLLNRRLDRAFEQRPGYITLTTHNATADQTNERELQRLQQPSAFFEAQVSGEFPENSFPTLRRLELKQGAQIMMLVNDFSPEVGYFNGKIGQVASLADDLLTVQFDDREQPVKVRPYAWHNIRYKWNPAKKMVEEEVLGTFEQLPVRLAWAITVHKSQGLTLEKVILDLERSFTHGQAYVGLSRCVSFEGIVLKTPIPPYAVQVDPLILGFQQEQRRALVGENQDHAAQSWPDLESFRVDLKAAQQASEQRAKHLGELEQLSQQLALYQRMSQGLAEEVKQLRAENRQLRKDLGASSETPDDDPDQDSPADSSRH